MNKFRAWDRKQKYFVYGELTNQGTFLLKALPRYSSFSDLEPWEQFTGLNDNKGKDIWEGDLLRGSSCVYIGNIRYDDYPDEYAQGVVKFGDYYIDTGCGGHGMGSDSKLVTGWHITNKYGCNYHPSSFEVLGNIHENPELIK